MTMTKTALRTAYLAQLEADYRAGRIQNSLPPVTPRMQVPATLLTALFPQVFREVSPDA